MRSERGQASVEWTGLLLLVALALGALVALAPGVEGRSLGATVAHRIACAAGGSCGVADSARPAAPPLRRPARHAGIGLPAARGVAGALVRRAWIACLGYRRYRYERLHPRRLSPLDPIPVREGLEIANACLNPVGFAGR